MKLGYVVAFGGILREIVQFRMLQPGTAFRCRCSVIRIDFSIGSLCHAQLPFPFSDAVQIKATIAHWRKVEARLWLNARFLMTAKHAGHIDAVQWLLGRPKTTQSYQRGQYVETGVPVLDDVAGSNRSSPFCDEGNTHAAFKCGCLPSANQAGISLVPGAVIAGETEEGVGTKPLALERCNYLPNTPIDLCDCVTDVSECGLSAKSLRGSCRIVRIGVGEVQEEWLVFMRFDEFDRFFGVTRSQQVAIRILFEDRCIANQGKRIHIVAPGNAIKRVETAAGWQVLRLVSQVPLANCHCAVAGGMKQIGGQRFIEGGSSWRVRAKCTGGIAAVTVAPCEDSGAGS